jgi:acetylornithine/succinyldiaminopimelate/putrescine aminotransferase/predicted amino acid dehydrogenase
VNSEIEPGQALNPTLKRLLSLCRMDRTWVRGEGVHLFDASGRRFLDCYAQYGAVALGHNAPAVVAAVRAALEAGEPAMVQPYRAPWAEALANELVRLAPAGLTRCVFTTSGAETVEAAIKLVRSRTGRKLIVSAEGSFHGKTMGALAATGQRHHSEGFGDSPSGFAHVPFGDVTALERMFAAKGPQIAALILEPIQGEGGVNVPPAGYLPRARALCTEHGAALILDEVQTGLGRTGRMFACEHEGVAPDVLLVAKALGGGLFPLGACLTTPAFWDERFALRHSSTFANNNVGCRVGLAVLGELQALSPLVAQKGLRLQAGLAELAARFPTVIAAVRGQGLLGGIELRPVHPDAGMLLSYLQHQGLYAYAVASTIAEMAGVLVLPTLSESNVLRVAPPLTITAAEIDEALAGIAEVCEQLARAEVEVILRALGAIGARDDRRPCATEPIRLPLPSRDPDCSYAFLAHYTRPEDLVITDPSLERLNAEELEQFSAFVADLPFGVSVRAPAIRSATGAIARGYILSIGMLPEQMLRRGRRRVEAEIIRGVDLAHALGARVVGLGGFTTPYSRRGESVIGRGPAITTGNALTAGMAFAATRSVAERRDLSLMDAEIAIVGARGSVGALCARLIARARPRKLLLVGNPKSGTASLEALAQTLECDPARIEFTTDLGRLERCQVVIAATGAGRPVLDAASLRAGTIVCDIARPPDASPRVRARRDLTVIDGGLVALPDRSARFGPGNLQGLQPGIQLACLSETIILALAGETRDRGIGDDISLDEVDEMMMLAERHGFRLAEPPLDALDVRFRARRDASGSFGVAR